MKWMLTVCLLGLSLLSGCTFYGTVEKSVCGLLPSGRSAELCYQDAAVQLRDPSVCEKIAGSGWSAADGNPRRNKCLRLIAEKEQNESICDLLVPGHFAESKEDCIGFVKEQKAACENCTTVNVSIPTGMAVKDEARNDLATKSNRTKKVRSTAQ
jgi:hypothetical protein